MKGNIPNKQDIILLLEDLLKKYPPTLLSPVISSLLQDISDHAIKAYQEIIGEYPELLSYNTFIRIYQPHRTASQIVDDILSPPTLSKKMRRERSSERGLSPTNNLLLDAERILSHPDQLIEKYKCTISKNKFSSLLVTAHKLKDAGKSIDPYFVEHCYPDNIRELIAYSLYVIYEVGIMFRGELYKAYDDKTKTIKKMPETDEYYRDAQKLKVTLRGKQIKKDTIMQDAEEYRAYLMGSPHESDRDRRFYEAKRFRYLTVLVIKINELLRKEIIEPSKAASSPPRSKSKDNYSFSIDDYLNKAMNIPRQIYGVAILELPSLKLSAKGSSTQS